jgi:nanoRNase/pAp phosphatase (c-di-AMP/oligoRNAs hydrolase)
MDALVAKYIELRDAKAALAKKVKERAERIDAIMERIEGAMLAHLQAHQQDSFTTTSGTVYKTSKTSATVADWDALLAHIRENEAWHLLDHKVNKTAVAEIKEATATIPPGVNWRELFTVQIRRA